MLKKKDKKSGDKQNEAKKTQKKETPAAPADKTGSDEKERDLYLIQIRYLDEQLERYQLKCDQLEREKKDLNSQYSSLENEKKDVVEFLKRSWLEKEDEANELTEQLNSQRQAASKDRDALQLQHSQLRQELQDRIEEVNAVNTTLEVKLASLQEFQEQKEQLISNMESLEKQLARQEEEHKADIHNREMKALLEKSRLEKEMESRVAAMEAEVEHLVDQRVPEMTRLALQENTEVKARINQLAEQTQVLMEKNSALQGHNSRLSVDVDILEQMLSETSRKICIREKGVEQLTEKCQQLQAELKECRQELEQLRTKHTGVLTEVEALRRDKASLSEWSGKNRVELSRLEVELQEERRRRSGMKSIMQEAAVTLRQALMDAPTDQDCSTVVQWKQLMEKLLVVLDRPTLTNSTTEDDQLDELQTSDSAAAREVILNPSLSLKFELARHRLGDLGLVPHPTVKQKHVLSSRTGAAASSNTHLPLHRRPSTQKTASSINRTDSGVKTPTSRNSFTKSKKQEQT